MTVYQLDPVAKPRPRVTSRGTYIPGKYAKFKKDCRTLGMRVPESADIRFEVPMPKSWSQRKRFLMAGQPHQQRPDLDNYVKAVLDAVLDDDSKVWQVWARKVWGMKGQIVITPL